MPRETVGRTFLVAAALCVVCSILVSSAAVGLKSKQDRERKLDKQRNILVVAGLIDADETPSKKRRAELFGQIEMKAVNLETGDYVADVDGIPLEKYEPVKAASDPDQSVAISSVNDFAGIKKREKVALVYLVIKEGSVDQVILPIRGKGLWSTLYGFIALDADGTTIRGLGFYEHGETPGLGGEVDNPVWKEKWTKGKRAFDDAGHVKIEVIKGEVTADTTDAMYKVDGLTGATITSRGVSNMLKYWLDQNGYGPYLKKRAWAKGTADG